MPENNYPHICREVGLSCIDCVQTVAEQTARVCTGLRGKAIGQLFVNLYTNPACSGMHAQFEAAYLEAQKKRPGSETLRAAAAIA